MSLDNIYFYIVHKLDVFYMAHTFTYSKCNTDMCIYMHIILIMCVYVYEVHFINKSIWRYSEYN